MTEKLTDPINAMTLETTKAPDHKVIYANNMRVGMTLGDIQIALGRVDVVPLPTITQQRVEDQATLIMSLPQAKAFIRMLTKIVDNYEENFGAVNVPEQFLVPLGRPNQNEPIEAQEKKKPK